MWVCLIFRLYLPGSLWGLGKKPHWTVNKKANHRSPDAGPLADHAELVSARAHSDFMVSASHRASKVCPVLQARHCSDPKLLADSVTVAGKISTNWKHSSCLETQKTAAVLKIWFWNQHRQLSKNVQLEFCWSRCYLLAITTLVITCGKWHRNIQFSTTDDPIDNVITQWSFYINCKIYKHS